MPLYIYQCERCGQMFEELVKMDAPPPERPDGCPKETEAAPCPLLKQVTAARAKFVGPDWGGWERTNDGTFMQRTLAGKATDNYGD